MQDDWAKWLPMVEFSNNNNASSATSLSPFYLNKGFHPQMSFGPDETTYESTRERLQSAKAEDINTRMQEILDFGVKQLEKSRKSMKAQADKHRKDVTYEVGDMVWLSGRNIKSTRPCWDLEDKQLGPFRVKERVGAAYQLELPATMRIQDVFSPKLLRPCATDPLPGQQTPLPAPIITEDNEEHWEVDNILDSR